MASQDGLQVESLGDIGDCTSQSVLIGVRWYGLDTGVKNMFPGSCVKRLWSIFWDIDNASDVDLSKSPWNSWSDSDINSLISEFENFFQHFLMWLAKFPIEPYVTGQNGQIIRTPLLLPGDSRFSGTLIFTAKMVASACSSASGNVRSVDDMTVCISSELDSLRCRGLLGEVWRRSTAVVDDNNKGPCQRCKSPSCFYRGIIEVRVL